MQTCQPSTKQMKISSFEVALFSVQPNEDSLEMHFGQTVRWCSELGSVGTTDVFSVRDASCRLPASQLQLHSVSAILRHKSAKLNGCGSDAASGEEHTEHARIRSSDLRRQ